ncbi:SWIM zinc finger family protein [Streptomyces jumonjinensis]|uniref:SWIM zinc finger family protein n=1 Tax=Streptomyces jumonjinensis TaxID=1945 RepID=UPI003790E274
MSRLDPRETNGEHRLGRPRLPRPRPRLRRSRPRPIPHHHHRHGHPRITGTTDYQVTLHCTPLARGQVRELQNSAADHPASAASGDDRVRHRDQVLRSTSAGAGLVPRPRDFTITCTCPDDAVPCKHAFALLHQIAGLLAADPLRLLTLRGLPTHTLPATGLGPIEAPVPTVTADAAYTRALGSLPALPRPADSTLRLTDPREVPGMDPSVLRTLQHDTAHRAGDLLNRLLTDDPGRDDPPQDTTTGLNPAADAARLTAGTRIRSSQAQALRRRLHLDNEEDFARRTAAWTYGGRAGHRTRTEPWNPDGVALATVLAEIIPALTEAGHPQAISMTGNRITCGDPPHQLHLRFGHDRLWHPYDTDGETPAGPPAPTPAEALHYLLARIGPGTPSA